MGFNRSFQKPGLQSNKLFRSDTRDKGLKEYVQVQLKQHIRLFLKTQQVTLLLSWPDGLSGQLPFAVIFGHLAEMLSNLKIR